MQTCAGLAQKRIPPPFGFSKGAIVGLFDYYLFDGKVIDMAAKMIRVCANPYHLRRHICHRTSNQSRTFRKSKLIRVCIKSF